MSYKEPLGEPGGYARLPSCVRVWCRGSSVVAAADVGVVVSAQRESLYLREALFGTKNSIGATIKSSAYTLPFLHVLLMRIKSCYLLCVFNRHFSGAQSWAPTLDACPTD